MFHTHLEYSHQVLRRYSRQGGQRVRRVRLHESPELKYVSDPGASRQVNRKQIILRQEQYRRE